MLELDERPVLVIAGRLDLAPEHLEARARTLSPDERERAARFAFARHRDRFVAARGLLRAVLGRALGAAPGDLRFGYGPHGKPELEGAAPSSLAFNLSHSDDLALVALARGGRVGVDLERLRELDHLGLAEQSFSPEERALLAELPRDRLEAAFFRAWTRREAFLKALGRGIGEPLPGLSVLHRAESSPRVELRADPREAARWTLLDLPVPAGFVAAVAVEGPGRTARVTEWTAETGPAP